MKKKINLLIAICISTILLTQVSKADQNCEPAGSIHVEGVRIPTMEEQGELALLKAGFNVEDPKVLRLEELANKYLQRPSEAWSDEELRDLNKLTHMTNIDIKDENREPYEKYFKTALAKLGTIRSKKKQ